MAVKIPFRDKPNYRPPNVNPPGELTQQILDSRRSDIQKLSPERRQAIAVSGITAPESPGQ